MKRIVLATTGISSLREQVMNESSFQAVGLIDFEQNNNNLNSLECLLRDLHPDLLVVYKMPFLLPENIFNLPTYGSINIHPSMLPKYGGANPWHEIFKNKERTSGVSIHRIDNYADHGELLAQAEFEIPQGSGMHNLPDLQAKAEQLAFPLLVSVIVNMKMVNSLKMNNI